MIMKLSKRFKSDPVACVVSLRDLVEFDDIDIPDVQRGLVWNPTQIANLWKSIFAGYPIGALTLYKQGEKWQLIDGQQRWHAIKLGLLEPDLKESMATLWTRWGKDWQYEGLMVCTRRHPWGFRWNEDKLERLPHGEMMNLWKKMMPKGDTPFAIPDMEASSAYWVNEGWIPLYRILAGERDSVPEPVLQKTEEWRKRVSADSLPLIRFSLAVQDADTGKGRIHEPPNADEGKSRIHELFTRINKGGTQISAVDYTYSTLCSYLGKTFKDNINTIAEDFMPPNRVARLYARLKYAEEEPTSRLLHEPPHASYWNDKEYDDEIAKGIADAKFLYSSADIPQTVYLQSHSDEWLTVVVRCIRRFRDIIQNGVNKEKDLLCMLPYVVCRDPGYHAKFCERFDEALKNAEPKSLIEMLAIGVAYAACFSIETGMYPVSSPKEAVIMREYPYEDEWLHVLCNPNNEPLLHFLQRSYMCRMLKKECGFYPHETATWGEAMNRPWDIDHIVPRSRWWLMQPEELMFREALPNKQILYYRSNREKQDAYIGVPAEDVKSPEDDFCYSGAVQRETETEPRKKYYGWNGANVFEKERPGRLHSGRLQSNEEPYLNALKGYKSVVNLRFGAMVQKLWSELKLADLVRKINDLPGDCVPRCLQLAVERWNILEKMKDKVWCALRHDSSKQQIISVKDFYHSLCSWLAVGEEENDAFRCFCWQQVDARTLKIEAGSRRLPDMTQAEWLKGAEKEGSRSAWWVEDGSFKDEIYVSGEGDSSLEKEVKKVCPEDLFEIDHDMKVVYP